MKAIGIPGRTTKVLVHTELLNSCLKRGETISFLLSQKRLVFRLRQDFAISIKDIRLLAGLGRFGNAKLREVMPGIRELSG